MKFFRLLPLLVGASITANSTFGALTDLTDGTPVKAAVSWSGEYGTSVVVQSPVSYSGTASMFIVDVTDKDIGTAGDQPSTVVQDYVMFCFDLTDVIASPIDYDYYAETAATLALSDSVLQTSGGASVAGYIPTVERLFEIYYYAPTKAGWASATATPDTDAAAFQIALWELAYETPTPTAGGYSWDLSSGNFILGAGGDAAAKAKAQVYLNSLTGNLVLDHGNRLFALIDTGNKQNLLGYVSIPEPSLLFIQGLMIVGFLVRRRR